MATRHDPVAEWREYSAGGDIADAHVHADALAAEVERLRTRQDELLQAIARLAQQTPLPDELQGWESQRAALVARVGTLEARVAELERDR